MTPAPPPLLTTCRESLDVCKPAPFSVETAPVQVSLPRLARPRTAYLLRAVVGISNLSSQPHFI